jgi:hypothetical protein
MQRIEHDRVLQMRHRWCVVYATPSLCQEELEELVFLLFLRRPKSEHPDFLCDVSCTATCYAVRRMERATLHESMVYATCRATLPRAAHPSASTNLVGHSRIAAARAFDAATRITILIIREPYDCPWRKLACGNDACGELRSHAPTHPRLRGHVPAVNRKSAGEDSAA